MRGIITSDRALSCNLLALRAFSTLGVRAVLMVAADTGKARGRRRPARNKERKDLIICNKTLQPRENKVRA
ncbi:hypothetical protein D3C87_2159080 [compost metagenome]